MTQTFSLIRTPASFTSALIMDPLEALRGALYTTLKPSSSPSSCRFCTSAILSPKVSRPCGVAVQLRSSELVALEYADLNLTNKVSEGVGHVRIRQHVNPLSASFSVVAQVPDWNAVFRDATLPLMVDIGSGSGRFLLWLAKRDIDCGNYLGLEIRHRLVKRAMVWAKELALNNIHFMSANATISFEQLVSTYPGSLKMVSVLCPDPHFKKRHRKRRVVQKVLVDSIVNNLMREGEVLIQSDVLEMAIDMRDQFDAKTDALQHIDTIDPSMLCDGEGWLLSNQMGVKTEREIHAESDGAKIYRRMYRKQI